MKPAWLEEFEVLKGGVHADFAGDEDNLEYHMDRILASQRFEITPLDGRGWLVVRFLDADRILIDWAVLEAVDYRMDDTIALAAILWHGEGIGAALRECRHSNFGHDGYVYYVNGPLLVASVQALRKYFDMEYHEDALL